MNRPWMPLYIADYLRDTAHLRAIESGAYLHLIMAYWINGRLPNDDRQLATIAKLSDKEWKQCKLTLGSFFGPEWSSHKRIDKELAKSLDVSNKRRAAAEQRHSKPDANASANAGANGHTYHTSPSPREDSFKSLGSSEGRKSGYSPPKHGAFHRQKGLVYVLEGTPEWDSHSQDFESVHGVRPSPDKGGGYWFKMKGEAAA